MGTRAETTKKEKAILKFIETQVLENGSTISKRNRKSNRIKFNSNSTCIFRKIRKRWIYKKRR